MQKNVKDKRELQSAKWYVKKENVMREFLLCDEIYK